jgi:outer membrane lipoprotein-sorting protein
MKRNDPRGRRDPKIGDLLRRTVSVPPLPDYFGEQLQARLADIDAEARITGVGHVSRRRPRRWVLLAAAALAALAVAVVVVGRHTAHEYVQSQPASAAEVVARVRGRLAELTTISATVSTYSADVEGPSLETFGTAWKTSADYFAKAYVRGHAKLDALPSKVIATSDDRSRLTTPLPEHLAKLDPEGTLTLERDVPAVRVDTQNDRSGITSLYVPMYSYNSPGWSGDRSGQGEIAVEYVNAPLGPPDAQQNPSPWVDSANALSLLANGTVTESTYDGRPALVVSADVTPGPVVVNEKRDGYSVQRDYDHIEMTIDRATWFPVRYTTSLHGKVDHDARLTDVRLGVPVEDAQFEPAFPAGVDVGSVDQGFHRVTLHEAAHTFG